LGMLNDVMPPSDTKPPPVSPEPGLTVSDGLRSMALVTPPVAMLNVPLLVIGPPVNPGPLPTLVTVPVPGNVCPATKVNAPVLAIESPVSAGAAPPEAKRRLRVPNGEGVLLPAGCACQRK